MKNNKIILMLGAVALFFSGAGWAAETTTFPGSVCKVADPTKAGQVLTHHSGAINNSTTLSVVVTCPLSRDFTSDVNGGNVVVKGVRSSSATVPFSCTFISRDNNGNSLASNTVQSSLVGTVTLSLNVFTSGVNGYYTVACTVPQKSTLIGLTLNE